ncbi:MAG: crosslink repair DNA glycosylase YcaQ family protein [Woeseiaceae bacterium]|jgi:ATP-dependent Lhr-like helicase|nr:crosslink repair DNA glycosylase YcaQ family protein [Woeseiaceae bacterium]
MTASRFQAATKRWFADNFAAPTDVQVRGWEHILGGHHALLVAPTGSGKTLAAFLAGIDRLGRLAEDAEPGVRLLYVSPLKALVYDIERNLRAPLVGITRSAEQLDQAFRQPSVAIRTGDTPQRERQRQLKEPGDILVTTPESLFLMLGSKVAETLATVETVIIDEIHALAPSKRGAHLALSLERLDALAAQPVQRIGLSATVRPLDSVARYLGGDRAVEIVDCSRAPAIDLEVRVPVPDMEAPPSPSPAPPGGSILGQLYSREVGTPQGERGIWPSIYPQLLEAVRTHRSSIIFVNSRGLCERLAHKLNELADEELVKAHHGSISHARRAEIEEGLKSGAIRGIVATSSLELGIDMGAVDLVMLVESPGSVARGLQRVGRAGHGVGEISSGHLYPKFRGDLLESAVVASRMLDAEIEAITVPVNPLDVLAQQIVAMCCQAPLTVDEIERVVRRAWSYRELSRGLLEAVLDMLSGHYPSTDFADLKPLLSWNRANDTLSPRRGAAMVTRMNAGTIPDRGAYGVHLGEDGPRVGELDEEMVFETRAGDNITLGASTWRVEAITRDRVVVTPAPGEPGRLPFWRGDGPGRPIELGRALGEFVRTLGGMSQAKAEAWLADNTPLDALAARNLAAYVSEQQRETGTLPTDRQITVERFRDELGDWRICILTPFGARVHAPWSMALQRLLAQESGYEMQVMYTDDGIVLRFADADELPSLDHLVPDPDSVEDMIMEQLAGTSLFAGLFRENAVRSLILRRRRPGQRAPLWAQRLKAQNLLATVQKYPSFPIVMETYRHAMADVFDLPAFKTLLKDLRSRAIRIDDVETRSASPFARSLVFAYVAAYLYEQDAPLAERKAQALTLDRGLLAELLGQGELRDLIDPAVLAELEEDLGFLSEDYRARDADDLHDQLRRLGDLHGDEVDARSDGDSAAWLRSLLDERRVVEIPIADERRYITADDAGLYRDALGIAPPAGLPDSFLEPVDDALAALIRRYARHRGPFLTSAVAARFGLRQAQVLPVLQALVTAGELVHGEIRPGGAEPDWCDAEVLRRLKRRNIAKLRDEVAAVDGRTLALFLPDWHGIGDQRTGLGPLREAIAKLQGLPLSWTLLNTTILPSRVAGYRADMLDTLAASGELVWVGAGANGKSDGRIALYLRDQVRDLLPRGEAYEPPSPLHDAILDCLDDSGASFRMEINDWIEETLPGTADRDIDRAIWDLVWDGQVSNDTFAPLRNLGRSSGRRRQSRLAPVQASAGGRWSLVRRLTRRTSNATREAVARARLLLDRYGVVSRAAAAHENLPGGWSTLYKVYRELEEQGQVRRGYFVEGLSGAQFAYAGAVDRLRGARDEAEDRDRPVTADDVRILAANDPANPYGAQLDWPETGNPDVAQPRRINGAWLLLVRGSPALYAARNGRALASFPSTLSRLDGALDEAIEALRRLPKGNRKSLLVIEKIDGVNVLESPLLEAFRAADFGIDYRGLIDVRPPGQRPVARLERNARG